MKIDIKSIPFKEMPYPSLDGYWDNPDGSVSFRTCEETSEKAQFLVLIHAMIEYYLCKFNGITEPEIADWDLMIEEAVKEGELPEDIDSGYAIVHNITGSPVLAPYRDQHHLATAVEGLLLPSMQYSEEEYSKEIETLWASQFKEKSDAGS
jgi:hypothetical protein